MKDAIRAYYAGFADREWLRLTRANDGALEFALTCHVLSQYLPPHARVLDIGGGPGRYIIWLAQHGHRVVLADLSPELLDIARAQIAAAGVATHVEDVVVADACDLHLADPVWMEQLLEHGVFTNDRAGRFTGGYGMRPEEIAPFLASYGLMQRTIVATESLIPDLQASLAELAAHHAVTYQAALDILIRSADDPSILGLANHLLYVGEKAAQAI